MSREREIANAFVSLAQSLSEDYDMVDLLRGLTADCSRLLDVASAGLLLADGRGVLHVVAASSERTRVLEMFQIQRQEGPCLECYRSRAPVSVADLREAAGRWPHFGPAAVAAGFASVHAVPMRLGDTVLGTLGLFGAGTGALNDDDLSLGQALAHVASVAILNERAAADQTIVNQQLQTALTSRVVLEQAKGVLAQSGGLAMDEAFDELRRFARHHNLRLSDVARAVVSRELPAGHLLADDRSGTVAVQPRTLRPA